MVHYLLILLLVTFVATINGDLLFMYAESSKISIWKTSSVFKIKEITISHYDAIYLAPHYKEDLIFYAYDKKLYRIHLVDENGNRKNSGKGELLINPSADHKEILFATLSSRITGIQVDGFNNKLYVSTYSEILQFDLEVKNEVKILVKQSALNNIHFYQGLLYFNSDSGIFRINANGQSKIETLVFAKNVYISSVAIDEVRKKLLYRQGSEVRMIDVNMTESSYPITNPLILLSDSSVTGGGGRQAVAANDRVMIWLSDEQLYLGVINSDYSFIPKQNIYLYRSKSYSFRPYDIVMFHHVFDQSATAPPYSILKICK
ncbi:uncharacterized protein LOC100203936 [Hydra vulgaris]|uniref:Uncharacterized protein LOC100203936 n=1 Tax=Hydra vulgaris TaxID=6087 RepID=A0ABM4CNR1_HYDVU